MFAVSSSNYYYDTLRPIVETFSPTCAASPTTLPTAQQQRQNKTKQNKTTQRNRPSFLHVSYATISSHRFISQIYHTRFCHYALKRVREGPAGLQVQRSRQREDSRNAVELYTTCGISKLCNSTDEVIENGDGFEIMRPRADH